VLKRLRLCPGHSGRVRRYRNLSFTPGINLLIGPNGSGKSTILRAIAGCPDCRRIEAGPTEYVLHDTESMNPRLASGPPRNRTNMVLRVRALFSSHGQSLQDAFSTLQVMPHTCLLVDEPESGQDFEHVIAFAAAMRRAAARGIQVICATHQLLFWEQARFIELRRGYRARVLGAVSSGIRSLAGELGPQAPLPAPDRMPPPGQARSRDGGRREMARPRLVRL
jgi:predicted ATPase